MDELNRKLAEWARLERRWNHNPDCHCGAVDDDDSERSWYTSDGELATRFYHEDIDFTHSLDACFKRLMPKAIKDFGTRKMLRLLTEWVNNILYYKDEPALALCKAIEKLIDSE